MAKRIVLILVIAFVAIQLYRPAKTNPPENHARTLAANTTMTPEVERLINHSCADCHTYNTEWPKYSYVAPISWLVTDDVNEGRRHLNMSDWAAYAPDRQQRKLDSICEEVDRGDMPLKQYTWLHKGTALTQPQREAICSWTKAEQQSITARTGVAVPPPKKGGMHAKE